MTRYFGALLILFTLLGVYQNKNSEPNQEIILKFSDTNISSDEAQKATDLVKKQLLEIGISAIRVQHLEEGQLKISYYTKRDIESIKEILSEESHIEIGYSFDNINKSNSSFPKNNKQKDYQLDVYEIHKNKDLESGLNGKFVFNLKFDYDRFFNPKVYFLHHKTDSKDVNRIVSEAIKVVNNMADAIDTSAGNIPEVRAGPFVHIS
ncbi:MAG: hypothetical protein GW839_07725 [Flavobacteriales bacterium]|nr:hypothetical protein [Flavobacteriia bacterium]NCP07113.1 hypothetical protein [Flavobacteriales bacterium]PIV94001.1 MAG: hypothetical protein COW44_06500 [Flavobacteriaceae bacterium CG17_big_fil_post_rev_8_21_14_2_50_33_15]PIY12413.1 MAG: hypothetical protein COZ17_03650 [Flavobacteriaceae bacterium CG_4_10_14_3_um_filter_33_47]PJB20315.1 MAG: hypothetical protein CO117_01395 [Flavobacteriaceae bacterium CG_4_9_14_3_um_filter_33_16]